MQKLLAANWKENPNSEKAARNLFRAVAGQSRKGGTGVVICPPFIYLEAVMEDFKKLKSKSGLSVGSQDVFWEEQGPFTSEVGPRMLKSLGVRYVIIGHSERRRLLKETDAMINKKIALALKDGLNVILCVGEPLSIRKKGVRAAKDFIKSQLKKDLHRIPSAAMKKGNVVVAYEPIWAIGTGRFDKPDDAADIARYITSVSKARVLYGGSVNAKNVADFVQLKDIAGALVGGASLKADEFKKMVALIHKQ